MTLRHISSNSSKNTKILSNKTEVKSISVINLKHTHRSYQRRLLCKSVREFHPDFSQGKMINKTEKALKPGNHCQKIIEKDEMIATNKGFITFNQEEEEKQHSRNLWGNVWLVYWHPLHFEGQITKVYVWSTMQNHLWTVIVSARAGTSGRDCFFK